LNSNMSMNRNHHEGGSVQIPNLIEMHFNYPPNAGSTQLNYMYQLYMTQVYQAYCYKVEVEYFRSLRNYCTDDFPGCNMGQQYWQLNDIWPGASWSSIDWEGRYKILQYYAQHFYHAFKFAGFNNGTHLLFSAINDFPDDSVIGGDVQFLAVSWKSGAIASWHAPFSVNAASSASVYNISHKDFLTVSGCSSLQDCVLVWQAFDDAGRLLDENWMFVASPKDSTAVDPNLTVLDVTEVDENLYRITIKADATAAMVFMETDVDGYFEDLGFIMTPGVREVNFLPRAATSESDIRTSLVVYSLYEAGAFSR